MRIIALIDNADIVDRIFKHLTLWDLLPNPVKLSAHDPWFAAGMNYAPRLRLGEIPRPPTRLTRQHGYGCCLLAPLTKKMAITFQFTPRR